MIDAIVNFLLSNGPMVIVSALLAISEALPFSESVKANSVFQAIVNGLKSILGILKKKDGSQTGS